MDLPCVFNVVVLSVPLRSSNLPSRPTLWRHKVGPIHLHPKFHSSHGSYRQKYGATRLGICQHHKKSCDFRVIPMLQWSLRGWLPLLLCWEPHQAPQMPSCHCSSNISWWLLPSLWQLQLLQREHWPESWYG